MISRKGGMLTRTPGGLTIAKRPIPVFFFAAVFFFFVAITAPPAQLI
jgi:hypothetical protein